MLQKCTTRGRKFFDIQGSVQLLLYRRVQEIWKSDRAHCWQDRFDEKRERVSPKVAETGTLTKLKHDRGHAEEGQLPLESQDQALQKADCITHNADGDSDLLTCGVQSVSRPLASLKGPHTPITKPIPLHDYDS